METYRLHRGRLIDHIQLVVNDFEASKAFYTAVLAVLEIPVVNTYDDYFGLMSLLFHPLIAPVPQVSRQDAIIWLSRPGIVRRWMLLPGGAGTRRL
jgi:catechol 2,3-dioxygenase-like lactoylglutathione lyase family enzyme